MADTVDATQLSHAIGRLSWAKLVQMTRLLCEKNDAVRDFYKERLFVNEQDVPQPSTPRSPDRSPSPSETSDDENEATPPPAPAPKPQTTGPKRSRPRFAICINCKTEFDVMTNAPKSCQYHWGAYSSMTTNISLRLFDPLIAMKFLNNSMNRRSRSG
jgi:hypothetical protein